MNEELTELLTKTLEKKPEPSVTVEEAPSTQSNLIELQRQAMTTQRQEKEKEWKDFVSYNWREVPPPILAKLYSRLPLGPSGTFLPIEQCMVLALEYFETGKNPLKGHIYILPSGRIGTSLEGLIIDLKRENVKLGKPKYERLTRPWPTEGGKKIPFYRKEKGREIAVVDELEVGTKCTVKIDDEECEYTCWFTEWAMPSNPNWFSRTDWMLRVRALMNCIKLGSGISVSEEIADEGRSLPQESSTGATAELATAAPSKIPGGRK